MKPLCKSNQNNVICHLKNGLSNREVALRTGVSRSTVNRIAIKNFPGRETIKNGRPQKLSSREKSFCVRKLTIGGKENAVQVTKSLETELNKFVNAQTVRRALKSCGLGAIVKPKKPFLSAKNIKHRLAWAKSHVDYTLDDWKRVIWSDETKIDRFGSDGRKYAWKRDTEPLQPKHVMQTVKHGGGNIKLWSCITYHGVGFITKIDGNMDQVLYQQILTEDLISTMKEYKMDAKKTIFQHDNDPKHTAKSIKEWLSKQGFDVMKWPAQSPDLNPIENIWALLKSRLYSHYERPPNGMLEHWERAADIWYNISKEECQKYIETMHKRCKAVIKAKGYWTKY